MSRRTLGTVIAPELSLIAINDALRQIQKRIDDVLVSNQTFEATKTFTGVLTGADGGVVRWTDENDTLIHSFGTIT